MTRLRAVVADDERLARARLTRLLAGVPEIEIVASVDNGERALAAIAEEEPDLVFLDVQMPELDGFSVLAAIEGGRMPLIIFTTAYDRYALRAFEVHAVDYLLKPFDEERLRRAVERAVELACTPREDSARSTRRFLEAMPRPPLDRLVVRGPGRITFVPLDEVTWLEAADNYVYLHVRGESLLLRASLKSLESRLDARRFLRIHRSTIVCRDAIHSIEPAPHGDAAVILTDGTRLPASRTYSESLRALTRA